MTLSGVTVSGDPDDTLSATLSGVPTLWTVKDGATALSNGAVFAAADLGSLVVSAPDNGGETASLTLTVSSSEGLAATSGTRVIGVTATAVAEAPSFGGPVGFTLSEEPGSAVTLTGVTVSGDPDDTLSATLSGVPTLWTVKDGATALSNGAVFAAADLGSLVVTAPDNGGETASLTLTVSSSEGLATTSGTRVIGVTATAVAEAPSFGGPVGFTLSEEPGSAVTLTGVTVSGDPDDTLSATLSGVPTLWTVKDGATALSNGAVFAAADLGSLVVSAPDNGGATASLTLTVSSSEGLAATSGTRVIGVTATAVAEAPSFGGPSVWSGGASVTLSGLTASGDADDTLSATITGLSSGWTLVDTNSTSSFTVTSITTIPVSDLGSLVVVAPSATNFGDRPADPDDQFERGRQHNERKRGADARCEKPERAKPERAKPERARFERGGFERGKPGRGNPDQCKPERG